MEISEDKRLREVGIDPNGDPIEIMKQVRLRYQKRNRRGRKKELPADPPRPGSASRRKTHWHFRKHHDELCLYTAFHSD
jgi:hypothetical protein